MFESIKNFITSSFKWMYDSITEPFKNLYAAAKDGFLFAGLGDFFLDTGAGIFASTILVGISALIFGAVAAVETVGLLTIAALVLSYCALYASCFLLIYGLINWVMTRATNHGKMNLVMRKRLVNAL